MATQVEPALLTNNATITEIRAEKKRQELTKSIIYHVGVGLFALIMLYPVIWLVVSSLKPPDEIFGNVTSLIPSEIRLENYIEGWAGFGGITFATFFKNSFIYAGLGTLIEVTASIFVGYGFARVKFRGKSILFGIMMLTLMMPTEVLLIPQYIIFTQLGWINTFLPLLVPRIGGGAFFIFMIVQFIRGIPIDLDEAAMIDGAGQFKIFRYVIAPQLTPAIITATIFCFYWTWDEFLGPLIYLTNPKLYTVSVALRSFTDATSQTNWGAVFSMLVLSLMPALILFIFFQRYLVEGIATTGMKG
ncbi:carbohydrate ABC transporter permease [Phototrophicus methaneseepsis]|uniref:Carbohydrate ABC transporter permease n=1 Tax=Phototrophicus methaneseepsis TaxID=2710758 RepID=A0A7S8IE38_9CHLR|nr:carbohydrate ABC transporter permease [Phototrophicus methaneseepsis]QPC82019.1 carbohydrate ABC transporter permease [Phototrophicus methaneseepsis]